MKLRATSGELRANFPMFVIPSEARNLQFGAWNSSGFLTGLGCSQLVARSLKLSIDK